MLQTRDDIALWLLEHDIQPTSQRLDIAQVLYCGEQHWFAEQILTEVRRHADISRATVYNTLNLLVARGLLREVVVETGKVFYDPNPTPHFHLYDVDHGRLIDLPSAGVQIQGLPSLPPDLVCAGIDLVIRCRRPTKD